MAAFHSPPGKKLSRAQKIATGGVFSSFALLVLLAGGLLPLATFVAPVFAGIVLIPITVEMGSKMAWVAYAAVSLLALFLVPDKELVLLFIFFFGYHPILHPYLQRIKQKPLRIATKFLIFNTALALVYGSLYLVFGPAFFQLEHFTSVAVMVGFGVIGNLLFLMYDILVVRLKLVYFCFIRKKIFR